MIFALGCALAMTASASFAQEWKAAQELRSEVRVAYGDLDLSSPHAAGVLLNRVRSAALTACGASEFSIPDYRRSVERSGCFQDAVARAVARIDAPTVTRLYDHALAQN